MLRVIFVKKICEINLHVYLPQTENQLLLVIVVVDKKSFAANIAVLQSNCYV